MAFHSREELGLRPPKRTWPLPTYPATVVVLHHGAGTTPKRTREADTWKAYQAYHMDTRGWSDIAYNFGVGRSGDRYEGRGWRNRGGATGTPHDRYSISICAIGNYETSRATDELVGAIIRQIRNGIRKGHLISTPGIIGHRDKPYATSCPGQNLYDRIPEIEAAIEPPTVEELETRVEALEEAVFEDNG